MVDVKEGTSLVLEQVWRCPVDPDECCIYRVPEKLRRVNPDAYTPRMLLIGPLHHSKKAQAVELAKQKCTCHDLENVKSTCLGYLNMEHQKKMYLKKLCGRGGSWMLQEFKSKIQSNEGRIRASYAESTAWIGSTEFVDMILLDSVFIIEFFLRIFRKHRDGATTTRDLLVDTPCLQNAVYEDLILLENQLPYFILEELFELVRPQIDRRLLFRNLALKFLVDGYDTTIFCNNTEVRFRHFTDILRCVRVATLGLVGENKSGTIKHLYNADKLQSSGVEFKAGDEKKHSINVRFENKCLYLPNFTVEDHTEAILRNVMALEQCHYPRKTYVCSYMMLLDFLIDTDKDVDLLIDKGIIKNWIGQQESIAGMMNKLCLGITEVSSCYADIAKRLNDHHENVFNRTMATLKSVYFANLWTGTATVAGVVLLLLTFIQTLASVLQPFKK